MLRIRTIIILAFFALDSQTVMSQTLPLCRSTASDADGDGYGWENNASCLIGSTSLGATTFTNLETGAMVDLIRARWEPSDLLDDIVCQEYQFDGAYYQPADSGTLYEHAPLPTTFPSVSNVLVSGTPVVTQSWSLDNGIYYGPSPLALSPWIQVIDYTRLDVWPNSINTLNAVRVWQTDRRFSQCRTTDPYAVVKPSGSVADTTVLNDCDYSNAAEYNGWGWDPVAQQSCEPVTAKNNGCDYTNAFLSGGWGWNPTTLQSCAPTAASIVQTSSCDYSNAALYDGWGWNAVTGQSCEPRNLCEATNQLRSKNGELAINVVFRNQRSDDVTVNWVNYQGQEITYGVLASGQEWTQPTYVTHPWVIRDSNGSCLQAYDSLTTSVVEISM